ncbi:MAG: protoporphyrinogen oxidase [Chlamydiae bacterium RIFCSPHIGHO2_12_FULL_44_59]|nr:MAG: protoporphyrinogen oxidase [Chlamydiae bacterium RIFCSPHIGHO2_01_FULL_44_39]OGN58421.1 MAG: protoporphyrinogen oxidase [Chlamydiae bacterium RIFCSPHIGHO2_02_FULL_45_9]OGN59460.1 MAG: protoporphyrinogen oxidase [Chlamydiae bacterium RIFCSPHIGHO2_12_FULL_44_59]OGN67213.1 MAG: protoporphyrinogen oxidase [Chlamydiae bacterium RIFCSPLOWO2_01_FULL_44_52]OGN67410.1 MAG: protoporphyrinogen oxidase [Chlamydiae bacterium RIFCSPLOWO2_02_FULL_45_22]OGN69142.1 MAG: protoporphyrinogen oxidase [Chlam
MKHKQSPAKIIVVGGGITGLSAAWVAKKAYPNSDLTLYEKQDRLGGWIQTSFEGGFLFEKGPRTFQASRSPHLLALIQELGLPILRSVPSASKRFLLHQGKLRSLGSLLPSFLPHLIRECFIPPKTSEEESIYDFASRRFGPKLAEQFFDPLTLGVYAGDMRKLSIQACFPAFHQMEQEHGSIVKAFFYQQTSGQKGLFTLPGGMQTLIDTLREKLDCTFVLNTLVEKMDSHSIHIQGQRIEADLVINALPPEVPKQSLWVVHVAYLGDVLKKKGFGYLIPTQEKENVLGVIFDSAIFPQQNQRDETRLTAMVRAQEKNPLEATRDAFKRHLGLNQTPAFSSLFFAQDAIPQFFVGCKQFVGISVDACIQRGKIIFDN